ncbi:unnamed protein product [Allacma fusca]|uniref:Uncharacterized protein n=1 Tax=Allacma fusca TaxID=39272 RepID=A0A8J2J6K0_9HEXA|nr:unnamed protein product [Allacma fusca]
MGKGFFTTCVVFLAVASAGLGQVLQLPALNIYPQWITISGFSSGGSFAQQMQISYSSIFSGIAVFSHTYYRCGPATGVQADYDNVCTRLGNRTDSELYDTNNVLTDIQNYYDQDLIDNPINIRNKRLYVFAGTRNPLFTTDMSLRILQVYEPLIQNTESVHTRVMEAQLLLPTVDFGAPCQESAESNLFLGSCGISGAYEALQFLLGDVVKKPSRVQRTELQRLREFDQTEFLYGFTGRHDMDTVGYYYVPSRCEYIKCLLHFYFHGCLTGREFNGTSHIVNSGYLEVAELSNIIMVFPQAVSSEGNEIGCWDTYGFTGLQYGNKKSYTSVSFQN